MGAVFFIGFLFIIFLFVAPFLVLNVMFIVKYYNNKQAGKTPKKRWLVILMIFLTINITVASIPTAYFTLVRFDNVIRNPPVYIVKTGKMLYWTMDSEYLRESIYKWFEMDEKKYVEFDNDSFYFEYEKDNFDKPVANIKSNPKTSNFFNEFMTWLLTGSTADRLGTSTIHPIKNNNGFELYNIKIYSGNRVFCLEEQLSTIRDYYTNTDNYDMQNIMISYNIYSTKSEKTGNWLGKPYVFVKEERVLSPDIYNKLENIYYDKERFFDYIDIPEKYNELSEIAAPGTPVHGYDERKIYAYDKDKIAYMQIRLALIEEQVYIASSSGMDYVRGYPIRDEELNRYLIDTLF